MPVYLKFGGRLVIVIVATALSALAVNLFIECNIGSDTLTVLLDGLHISLGISVGLASSCLSIVFLAVGLLLNRKSIGFSSVLYSFLIGPLINWIHPFIANMELADLMLFNKIIIVIMANICFSMTYVLLMKFGNGMYAIDAILRYTESKFGLRYDFGRIGVDAVFLTTGFLFGGIVGIGTVIAFALTGPGTLLLEKLLSIPLQKKLEK
ncbi:YitT family protein [Paenibacillus macerans]|uniref:YczE/YyaS/YitT family protein n=1 Tax=Paenibacillus macerans TaxID=44252 RepID=UPI00203F874F|nr:membrane protein [Paenibacillus macerans]MCM3699633.1 membrane protein [Paenibacillus macerans]